MIRFGAACVLMLLPFGVWAGMADKIESRDGVVPSYGVASSMLKDCKIGVGFIEKKGRKGFFSDKELDRLNNVQSIVGNWASKIDMVLASANVNVDYEIRARLETVKPVIDELNLCVGKLRSET